MSGVNIQMTEEDFENLVHTSMSWGLHWKEQMNRFAPQPMLEWKWAYWVDNYSSVLLARAFLTTQHHETQTLYDRAFGSWLILTNYATETWRS